MPPTINGDSVKMPVWAIALLVGFLANIAVLLTTIATIKADLKHQAESTDRLIMTTSSTEEMVHDIKEEVTGHVTWDATKTAETERRLRALEGRHGN
jgi:hypothetical protein